MCRVQLEHLGPRVPGVKTERGDRLVPPATQEHVDRPETKVTLDWSEDRDHKDRKDHL